VVVLEREVEYLKKKLQFMEGEIERTGSGLESARREKLVSILLGQSHAFEPFALLFFRADCDKWQMVSGSMRASERQMKMLLQESASSRRLLDAAKEAEALLQEVSAGASRRAMGTVWLSAGCDVGGRSEERSSRERTRGCRVASAT
jgi:hypothetical protein